MWFHANNKTLYLDKSTSRIFVLELKFIQYLIYFIKFIFALINTFEQKCIKLFTKINEFT